MDILQMTAIKIKNEVIEDCKRLDAEGRELLAERKRLLAERDRIAESRRQNKIDLERLDREAEQIAEQKKISSQFKIMKTEYNDFKKRVQLEKNIGFVEKFERYRNTETITKHKKYKNLNLIRKNMDHKKIKNNIRIMFSHNIKEIKSEIEFNPNIGVTNILKNLHNNKKEKNNDNDFI